MGSHQVLVNLEVSGLQEVEREEWRFRGYRAAAHECSQVYKLLIWHLAPWAPSFTLSLPFLPLTSSQTLGSPLSRRETTKLVGDWLVPSPFPPITISRTESW